MESRSLKIIQILSKICFVISKIVFIVCIVGVALCLVGLIANCVTEIGVISIGGVSIHGIIEAEAGMSIVEINSNLITGIIGCITCILLGKKANVYFKNELDAGTPFTFSGAREIRKLGIWILVVSIIAGIVSSGITFGLSHMYKLTDVSSFDAGPGAGLGIVFIVLSVIFTYGAEVREKNPS